MSDLERWIEEYAAKADAEFWGPDNDEGPDAGVSVEDLVSAALRAGYAKGSADGFAEAVRWYHAQQENVGRTLDDEAVRRALSQPKPEGR